MMPEGLFDRLTGGQLLYYSGVLRGLDRNAVRARSADLAARKPPIPCTPPPGGVDDGCGGEADKKEPT